MGLLFILQRAGLVRMNELRELHDWMIELKINIMCNQGTAEELIAYRKLYIKLNRIRNRMLFRQKEHYQNRDWGFMR